MNIEMVNFSLTKLLFNDLINHNIGDNIKLFLTKNDISNLDVLSNNISKNKYRYHLLKNSINHILKLSDVPLSQYKIIEKQLRGIHLVDYFIYIVSKMEWLYNLINEYSNTQIHCLFIKNIPNSEGKSVYRLAYVHDMLSTFISHISNLLSKRKIILLNMYANQFPIEFNKQYNVDCIILDSHYPYKTESYILSIIHKYISSQCIPREYIRNLLFSDKNYNMYDYIHCPQNETYLTLLKYNFNVLNSKYLKLNSIVLKKYFNKLANIRTLKHTKII